MALCAGSGSAQSKGQPGKFDFYLLNLSWAPEYCTANTGAECTEKLGLVMHGLWPQYFNGSYPDSCATTPPPADLSSYLDLIPELGLLQHEWSKHGTCSGLSGDGFFTLERKAFHALKTPPVLQGMTQTVSLPPAQLLADFYKVNLGFPQGSLALSCGNNFLTAVEACLSKSGLQPIACQGVRSCGSSSVKVVPPGTAMTRTRRSTRRHTHSGSM